MNRLCLWAAILFLGLGMGCDSVSTETSAGTGILQIHADKQGAAISDILYGVFFEDINHGADGGLHAEMVRNRSFEFSRADGAGMHGLTAWSLVQRGGGRASIRVGNQEPLNNGNRNYLVIELAAEEGLSC
ncbi:MAG TPA: alpha-N-arabinofuranosidase, partial [Limnochordia bacterium]|nr:alpha-N-arabinofuranosidase [Limnochordia bacterium]